MQLCVLWDELVVQLFGLALELHFESFFHCKAHHCLNGLLPLAVARRKHARIAPSGQVPFRFAPATGRAPASEKAQADPRFPGRRGTAGPASELSHILPVLSALDVFTLVVTSAVIPIPAEWMKLSRLRVAVSIDGLSEHHDVGRKPATYERILKSIEGREVDIHWTMTRPMLSHVGYMEEYVAFWSGRREVNRIWVSLYTPQLGEQTPEMLGPQDREAIARELPALFKKYPKLLINEGISRTIPRPPNNPGDCLFSKMSANYSADLKAAWNLVFSAGHPTAHNAAAPSAAGCTGSCWPVR